MRSARHRLSIKRKLQLIGLVSLVSVLALAGSSAHFALRTRAAAHLLLESGIVGTGLANRLELLIQTHRGVVLSAPAELNRERLSSTRDTLRTLNAEIVTEVAKGQSGTHLQSASWSALADNFEIELPALFESGDRVIDLAYNFVQDQSLALSQGPYTTASRAVLGQIGDWRDHQSRLMNEQVAYLLDSSDAVVSWAYWGAGTALPVGLFGFAMVHGLLNRLHCIQRAMLQLASRDNAVLIPCLEDHDEIGAMARSVQVFRGNALMLSAQDIEIRRANLQFGTALRNMSQGLCQYDADGRLEVVNQRFCDLLGVDSRRIQPGISYHDVLQISIEAGNHPGRTAQELITERQAFMDQQTSGLALLELSGGRVVSISHSGMEHGGWVSTYEDVTARRAAEAKIAHMARHDSLTGLPNRMAFGEGLEEAIADAGRGKQSAVLCLDLDHFKTVNDTLGHPIGDGLLRTVAARLTSCARDGDIVARLGGDEFAIVQADIDRPEDARLLAERIALAIQAPFIIEGHQVVVGVSIGLALVPDDGASAEALLKNADIALYRAKLDGRGGVCFFEAGMNVEIQRRRTLETDLRHAIADEQFEVFYQPLINARTQVLTGFEALIRWRHPERGMVSPAEFIALAEEVGLIEAMGTWVLNRACTDAAGWPAHVKVAVNLSPRQFVGGHLVREVERALVASGLAASRLELEITEAVLLLDNDATLSQLRRLHDLGVRIAMDDFGTGYSSLSYLRRFPFDKIKIDQSFVRDLVRETGSLEIIRAVVGLGKALGMDVLAEGVETAEQLAILQIEGCDELQGFLFSKPLPLQDVDAIIASHSGAKEGPTSGPVLLVDNTRDKQAAA